MSSFWKKVGKIANKVKDVALPVLGTIVAGPAGGAIGGALAHGIGHGKPQLGSIFSGAAQGGIMGMMGGGGGLTGAFGKNVAQGGVRSALGQAGHTALSNLNPITAGQSLLGNVFHGGGAGAATGGVPNMSISDAGYPQMSPGASAMAPAAPQQGGGHSLLGNIFNGLGGAQGVVSALGAGAGLYQGAKDSQRAAAKNKQLEALAMGEWNAGAPLRDRARMLAMQGVPQAPNLGHIFRDNGNPYARTVG